MVDHQTGLSFGYGFVRFVSAKDAKEAIVKMTGYRMNNKILLCKLSNSSNNTSLIPEPCSNLYIRPLPTSFGTEELRTLFVTFGPINAVKVMVDKITGESIQIGFVRFENQEDASAALNAMNGRKLEEDQAPINVKYAESEQQRIVRKSRVKSLHPSPPPSPTHYFPPPPVVYNHMPFMPSYVPVNYVSFDYAPSNYFSFAPLSPPSSPHHPSSYSPMWYGPGYADQGTTSY